MNYEFFLMDRWSIHSHLHVGIWGHMVMSVAIGSHTHQQMVLLYLPRQFKQDFSGQLDSIVFVFGKFHKLNKISLSLIALEIHHLAVIIIKLVH